LWGLDPKGDGVSNKKIVDDKKAANAGSVASGAQTTTKTDQFSQEILSTILALHQSGTLTPEVIVKVSASVGDSLDAKRLSARTYTLSDLDISQASPASAKASYKKALKGIIDQYADIVLGSETFILADGLGSGGEGALKQLQPIAEAYGRMSKQIISLKTPSIVAQNTLDLANATALMSGALMQAQLIYSDALVGMVGVGDYTQASTLADNASRTLAAYFAS